LTTGRRGYYRFNISGRLDFLSATAATLRLPTKKDYFEGDGDLELWGDSKEMSFFGLFFFF
jgi:hypothetical protein